MAERVKHAKYASVEEREKLAEELILEIETIEATTEVSNSGKC